MIKVRQEVNLLSTNKAVKHHENSLVLLRNLKSLTVMN